jgi:hypothetical protein
VQPIRRRRKKEERKKKKTEILAKNANDTQKQHISQALVSLLNYCLVLPCDLFLFPKMSASQPFRKGSKESSAAYFGFVTLAKNLAILPLSKRSACWPATGTVGIPLFDFIKPTNNKSFDDVSIICYHLNCRCLIKARFPVIRSKIWNETI